MGSWNQTCGISNLHITRGKDMVVVALIKQIDDNNRCYTNAYYKPILMPFYSKYNDYGGGEESSGIGLNIVLDIIKENLIEIPPGESIYHDFEITRDGFCEEIFWGGIKETRLKTYSWNNIPVNFDFMLIHREVYDYALENYEVYNSYFDENQIFQRVKYKFSDIEASLDAYIPELVKQFIDDETFFLQFGRVHGTTNLAKKWLSKNDNSSAGSHLLRIQELVKEFAVAGDVNSVRELLIDNLKIMFIEGWMDSMQKAWIPAINGSQTPGSDAHRILTSAVIDVLDKEDLDREYD